MKRNKRVLAGITVICMLLSLQPVTVQAAGQQVKERTTTLDLMDNSTTYQTTRGGTAQIDITKDITDSAEGWSWNTVSNTLTLNGANIKVAQGAVGINLPNRATIELAAGSNNVVDMSGAASDSTSYAIDAGMKLTIRGKGELTVIGGPAVDCSYGIYSSDGQSELVQIEGGARVKAIGGTVSNPTGGSISCGIRGKNGVIITGGAVVNADGGSGAQSSYGLYAESDKGILISDQAVVEAESGSAQLRSHGIYSLKSIVIDNAGVTATGGTVSAYNSNYSDGSSGIFSQSEGITISGISKVNVTGGNAELEQGLSYGIKAYAGMIMIFDSALIQAEGGTAGDSSYGIEGTSVTISGSGVVVVSTGGKGTKGSYGIDSNASFSIYDATVSAFGGEANNSYGMNTLNGNSDSVKMEIYGTAKVTAVGGRAQTNSSGICVRNRTIEISGPVTINAEGGPATSGSSLGISMENSKALNIPVLGGRIVFRGETQAVNKEPILSGPAVILGSKDGSDQETVLVTEHFTKYRYLEILDELSNVTISPTTATVVRGKTCQLNAISTTKNGSTINNNQFVDWSVSNAASTGTSISAMGLLTAASNETASALTVTAKSKLDPSLSASAIVSVSSPDSSSNSSSGGGGGGGGGAIVDAASFVVTAEASSGGSISPSGNVKVTQDKDQSFAITPNRGYKVADVLVDGTSVGPVEKYTFEKVRAAHTIRAEFSRRFEDVPDDAWYSEAVEYVTAHQVFAGTSETRFSPGDNMSRAMLATVLYRMSGEPALTDEERNVPFTDVDLDSWYGKAVCWAKQQGVVSGIREDAFCPNDPLTREQFVSMLYRYAGNPAAKGDLSGFSDGDRAGAWASDALSWAVENRILSGKGNNLLDPKGHATRGEVAVMLMKYLQIQ